MPEYTVQGIGHFECAEEYSYDVPRQGSLAGANRGRIILDAGMEQALYRLDSFSHIWVVFLFDRNSTWKKMIVPPRHTLQKVGVFASRSPYRPSGIGISCVRLVSVKGLCVEVEGHDLLDGTPILDIKPYLPYADSFPDASPGWTGENIEEEYEIAFTGAACSQLEWLQRNGVPSICAFIHDRLSNTPLDRHRNRLMPDIEGCHVLAYRTWRVLFTIGQSKVIVRRIASGYSEQERLSPEDKYQDKAVHRLFCTLF